MKNTVTAIIAMLVACTFASTVSAKYTIDDLTSKQRSELRKRMETYSLMSSIMDYCGRDPRWIDQMAKEAKQCIEPSTISQVLREYRGMHEKNLSEIRVPAAKLCNNPNVQGLVQKAKRMFARDFARAKAFCQSHRERPDRVAQ